MIITHEKLGKIEVVVTSENDVKVLVSDLEINSMVNCLGNNKFVLEFYVKKEIQGIKIPGIKIAENEYLELKKEMKDFRIKQEEMKYEKWLDSNVTYHCSYDFSTKKTYSKKAIRFVRKQLINDKNVKTLTGFGDYNSTETYEIKNSELIKMLDDAEKENEKETDSEIEEKIEIEKKIFAKAKETNTRQILKSYSVDCDDDNEACEIDTITKYALPDGFTETIRSHNW